MLQNLKTGFSIVKFGLSIKMQLTFAVVFLAFGFVFEFITAGTNFLGGFYIVLSAMFVYQLIVSADISTMVQTSPYKKRLQTTLPMLACTPLMLLGYTVVVGIRYYLFTNAADAEAANTVLSGMFAIGWIIFFTTVYMGLCYKFFVAAMVLLFIFVIPVSGIGFNDAIGAMIMESMGFAGVALFGYAAITVGCFLGFLLSKALYKYELSKMAFGAALKRAIK